jgi:murein DD-endopeptidase MepM/ murein hydrolase activator NlpD
MDRTGAKGMGKALKRFGFFRLPIRVFVPILMFLVSCGKTEKQAKEVSPSDSLAGIAQADSAYGMDIRGLEEQIFTISSGQSLSGIFGKLGVSADISQELIAQAGGLMDLKSLRAGHSYRVFCRKGPDGKPVCMVYEPNPRSYLVFQWSDTVPRVYKEEKPMRLVQKSAAGIITQSLYHSIVEQGLNPVLCYRLDDIFKWSVDFFALAKGDRFRVVYEEWEADSVSMGIERIVAASFLHRGKEQFAYRFERDGQVGFYDASGQSMKTRFLKAPLEYSRISSKFSKNRMHPVLKRVKPHLGTDYAAPHGTPIVSVADGVVTDARFASGNGNYVKVKHDGTYTTQYLHMSRFAPGVRAGVRVRQGQVIGFVGSTGLATGPHLCYRFWKNGKQVDPFREQPQATVPLDSRYLSAFKASVNELAPKLLSLSFHENLLGEAAQTVELFIP